MRNQLNLAAGHPARAAARPALSRPARLASLLCALALCFVCASAQERPAEESSAADGARTRRGETARAAGSITGRVMSDEGRPVAGAAVFVGARSTAARQSKQAVTGEDGRFRFDNLEPGAYIVSAFASGYVNAPRPAAERQSPRYYRPGDDVQINLTRGGVVTGTVTDARGLPLVAVRVRALLVRDADGRPVEGFTNTQEQTTDDRGVYRVYGLAPGTYLVAAGGPSRFPGPFTTPYDKDAPTFFPGGTRDVASEVTVAAGQEAAGIDIRYRGQRGHAVSGSVEGAPDEGNVRVQIVHVATGHVEPGSFGFGPRSDRSFIYEALPDGDYDLTAFHTTRDGDQMASAPQRVTVRGADVTGLRLALAPFASVGGRLRLERSADKAAPAASATTDAAAATPAGAGGKPACEGVETALPQEAVVVIRRDDADEPKNRPRPAGAARADVSPDARGDFRLRTLAPGRYRFEVVPPGDTWYVRSLTMSDARPATAAPRTPAQSARRPAMTAAPNTTTLESLTLRQGESVSGLLVVLAPGAASLRGRVLPPGDNASTPAAAPPARLRVHLVPAAQSEDDALRFAETLVAPDGSFVFQHLAPGRYLLLAHLPDTPPDAPSRPAAWDAATRARLRREAEAANVAVELQPCQRAEDIAVRYPATRQ